MLIHGEEAPSRARCHAQQALPQSGSKPVKRPDLSAVSPCVASCLDAAAALHALLPPIDQVAWDWIPA
jgi:hypothetical protein